MPTHLYCLLPAGTSVLPPSADVRGLSVGAVTAWVSDSASDRLSRNLRDAARATVEHDGVVGAAVAQGITPIPASLADPYESDAAAVQDVLAHAGAIAEALRAVADRVEMTTIIALDGAPPAAGTVGRGRAYLEQLRSTPRRAESIADQVEASLASIGGPSVRRGVSGGIALSHLIRREDVPPYRSAAERAEGPGYRIVVDGPRGPYSFASFGPHRGMVGAAAAPAA